MDIGGRFSRRTVRTVPRARNRQAAVLAACDAVSLARGGLPSGAGGAGDVRGGGGLVWSPG